MADPVTASGGLSTVAGPIAAVAAGTMGFVSSFFGGGSSESGMKLPPELEFSMLEQSFKSFEQMTADYKRAETLFKTYEDRFNTISKGMEANIPSEELRSQLATNTAKIALAAGKDMEQLIKDGLITPEAKADFDRLKEIESQDYRNPQYDAARAQQKQQLMQNLQRSGITSPQAIQEAMARFDNETAIGAFTVAQELRTQESQRITGRMGMMQDMRVSNQGILQNILGMNMANLQGYSNMATQVAGVAQQGMAAGASGLEYNRASRADRQGMYNELGEFKFSKNAKNYLASGIPQSGYSVTPDQFKTRQAKVRDAAGKEAAAKSLESGFMSGGNKSAAGVGGGSMTGVRFGDNKQVAANLRSQAADLHKNLNKNLKKVE